MSNYTTELDNTKKFENITIFKRLKEGILVGYKIETNEGYAMHDTTEPTEYTDPETGVVMPVQIYYCTQAYTPKNYNFDNFSWVAVPRSSVQSDQI